MAEALKDKHKAIASTAVLIHCILSFSKTN